MDVGVGVEDVRCRKLAYVRKSLIDLIARYLLTRLEKLAILRRATYVDDLSLLGADIGAALDLGASEDIEEEEQPAMVVKGRDR
jgi:hypothetical protein